MKLYRRPSDIITAILAHLLSVMQSDYKNLTAVIHIFAACLLGHLWFTISLFSMRYSCSTTCLFVWSDCFWKVICISCGQEWNIVILALHALSIYFVASPNVCLLLDKSFESFLVMKCFLAWIQCHLKILCTSGLRVTRVVVWLWTDPLHSLWCGCFVCVWISVTAVLMYLVWPRRCRMLRWFLTCMLTFKKSRDFTRLCLSVNH